MTLGLAFYVLMLLWLVFGSWNAWQTNLDTGGELLLFVLILILGWHDFGPPIHG